MASVNTRTPYQVMGRKPADVSATSISSVRSARAGRPSSLRYAVEWNAERAAAQSPLSPGRMASACPLRNVRDNFPAVANRADSSLTACTQSSKYIITP